MKKFLTILILVAPVLTGCGGQGPPSTAMGSSSEATPTGAPAVLLNAPGRARDASAQVNERARQVEQALPQTPRDNLH